MRVKGGEQSVTIPPDIYEKLEQARLERKENLSRFWSDNEVAILKGYYNLVSRTVLLDALPKRTWASICCKVANIREDGGTFKYEETDEGIGDVDV